MVAFKTRGTSSVQNPSPQGPFDFSKQRHPAKVRAGTWLASKVPHTPGDLGSVWVVFRALGPLPRFRPKRAWESVSASWKGDR